MKTQPIEITYTNCPCTKGASSVLVYPLNEESIEKNIPDGIMPANYRIGRLVSNNYYVIYVGRVDIRQDRGLQDRMLEHLDEFKGDCYFDWNSVSSVHAAYRRECEDYHCWGQYGYLENKKHPRKPDNNSTAQCPVCGQ